MIRRNAVRSCRTLVRDEAGSSLVEFALSIGLLLTVVFGVMGFSMAAYTDHFVALAAQAAARYAAVRGSTWSTTCASVTAVSCVANASAVTAYVRSVMPAGTSYSNLVVQTTWPGTTPAGRACFQSSGKNSPGCTVEVTVKYSFSLELPLLPTDFVTLSSTGALPITR